MIQTFHETEGAGFGLTTARIFYRMPDHLDLLQLFVWQHYDIAPEFPELARFLAFWQREIEGPLHSVRVAHRLISGERERAIALNRVH
jgi:uncharacterized protein Usg